jgi:hypothetical protein
MNTNLIKSKWFLVSLIFLLFSTVSCVDSGQEKIDYREGLSNFNPNEYPNKNISDGPYFFYENDELILKWLEEDQVVKHTINDKNFDVIEANFGMQLKPEWLSRNSKPIDYKQEFKDVDKIIAISDIHGQYKLFVKLLREYNIIDENNNWSFGTGNLIIVGDIFDRGPQVNEALWLVFKLSHQALESGGKLHYLMGNHEEMILNKDHRYVNDKYLASAKKLNLTYEQLFTENTVIGNWLRTKPVIIQINDVLFVHAGISPEFIEKGFTAEQANRIFLNDIIGKTKAETKHDTVLSFLRGSEGPIWYRGYFRDDELDRDKVDLILKHFNKKHIVVGHTSQVSIVSLFRNRIFGVDSSIKNGKYGEVLIYDKGDFFRGTIKMTPDYIRN